MRSLCLHVATVGLAAAASLGAEGTTGAPVERRPQDVLVAVTSQDLQRQHEVLSRMPSVRVGYAAAGPVRFVRGETGLAIAPEQRGLKPGASGSAFLGQLRDVLLARGTETLTVASNQVIRDGYRVLKLNQTIRGIPVLSGGVAIGLDESTGLADSVQAQFLPDRDLPATPTIEAAHVPGLATEILVSALGAARRSIAFATKPSLAYSGAEKDAEKVRLVWVVEASYRTSAGEPALDELRIDALDGSFAGKVERMHDLFRLVSTANNSPIIGVLPQSRTYLFVEGGSSADPVANAAYFNTGLADNAWTAIHPSLSYLYPPAEIVVHVGTNHNNSYSLSYNGAQYLMFGDGPSTGSLRVTAPMPFSLDVVAHEYGHGVNRLISGVGESTLLEGRALNEFYSDLSSVIADVSLRGGFSAGPTWEIGEIYANYPGQGARSWASPDDGVLTNGRLWYPFRSMNKNNFHENSTIAGHAYYLLVNGGMNASAGYLGLIPSIQVPPVGYSISQSVFTRALQRPEMVFEPDYFDVRDATAAEGDALGSTIGDAVRTAWRAVGVGYGCSEPPSTPTVDVYDFLCRGRFLISWTQPAGATTYHAERVRLGWPWDLATTTIDAPVNNCEPTVPETQRFRLRACNGCGCSGWSPIEMLVYQRVCL